MKGQWDSDVEDESDGPEYPPGIMKVNLFIQVGHGALFTLKFSSPT